ncbi:hypothetical protein MIZ03_4710 [Rhodoferax lithotrophicus]|uniref:Uncharacterized protein n=1 Tax=Rhodoferax lithotrophicus TaxID=2798804 RepID=A0ABM7MTT2_9BURK|nr:hypothetical protein MIZ03_4710 [Rhodoferax sp. MIZ03]
MSNWPLAQVGRAQAAINSRVFCDDSPLSPPVTGNAEQNADF